MQETTRSFARAILLQKPIMCLVNLTSPLVGLIMRGVGTGDPAEILIFQLDGRTQSNTHGIDLARSTCWSNCSTLCVIIHIRVPTKLPRRESS